MKFIINRENSAVMLFYIDYETEEKLLEELEWLTNNLCIKRYSSGTIINYEKPYYTVNSILIRPINCNDSQWNSILSWGKEHDTGIPLEEIKHIFRIEKDICKLHNIIEWSQQYKISYKNAAVVDAISFDKIQLIEFIINNDNDAVMFKLKWYDHLIGN